LRSNASGTFGSAGRARRRGGPRLRHFGILGGGGGGGGGGGLSDFEREPTFPLILLFMYLNYIYYKYNK